MRFYDIHILDDAGNIIKQYSSLKNGVYNPGALMVEFDILRFGESTPAGETHLAIWGIGPKEMQQVRQDLIGKKYRFTQVCPKDCHLPENYQKNLPSKEPFFSLSETGRELIFDKILL